MTGRIGRTLFESETRQKISRKAFLAGVFRPFRGSRAFFVGTAFPRHHNFNAFKGHPPCF